MPRWALSSPRQRRDTISARITTLNLAEINHTLGRTGRSIELIHTILPRLRESADLQRLGLTLTNLAGYLAAVDDFEAARDIAREAIRIVGDYEPGSPFVATSFEPLALTIALAGDAARGAILEGYADAALRGAGIERHNTETVTFERLRTTLEEALAPGDLALLLEQGASLTAADAIRLALRD